MVVGWVSSSRGPSSRKTIEQSVRRTGNNYSTPDRNDQEAYVRSRGIMLRGGWEEGGVVDQHPGRRCFAASWRDSDKTTDRRTSKRTTTRASTDTGLRHFGSLLPGTCAKDQPDLLTLVRGSLAMELFADSSALCDHSRKRCVLILVGIRHKAQHSTGCDPLRGQNRIVPPPQYTVYSVRPTR